MIKLLKTLSLVYLVLFTTGCSFIASRLIPLNDIQSPTGEHSVGTQTFYWVDEERDEWFSQKKGDKRELVVQVWYPSSESDGIKDPWLDNASLREEAIIDNFKVPKFIAKAVNRVDTDTIKDSTPLLSSDYPVIIFSHGFEGFRSQNTTQIQELVSNGYIVFALDHTYDAALTILPDGIPNSPLCSS